MLEGFLMSRLELAIQGVGMRFEKCQGFYDMTPEDMEKFRYIESVFREQCLGHGYQEIRTLHWNTSTFLLLPALLHRTGLIRSTLFLIGTAGVGNGLS